MSQPVSPVHINPIHIDPSDPEREDGKTLMRELVGSFLADADDDETGAFLELAVAGLSQDLEALVKTLVWACIEGAINIHNLAELLADSDLTMDSSTDAWQRVLSYRTDDQ